MKILSDSKDQLNEHFTQLEKESYIADMLIRTLYSNDVNNQECYQIIKLFKERVLGDVDI